MIGQIWTMQLNKGLSFTPTMTLQLAGNAFQLIKFNLQVMK